MAMNTGGADASLPGGDGSTAMHLAVGQNDSTLLGMMVDGSREMDRKDRSGDTTWHMAMHQGKPSLALMIIRSGRQVPIALG